MIATNRRRRATSYKYWRNCSSDEYFIIIKQVSLGTILKPYN